MTKCGLGSIVIVALLGCVAGAEPYGNHSPVSASTPDSMTTPAPKDFAGSGEASGGPRSQQEAAGQSESRGPAGIRERLARQLVEAGLPAPEDVGVEGGGLLVRLGHGVGSETGPRKPESLLPVLVVALGVASECGLAVEKITATAPSPGGETLLAESSAERIRRYLRQEMSAQEFASASRLEMIPQGPGAHGRGVGATVERFQRGKALVERGEHARALPVFQAIWESDSRYPGVNKALADCYRRTDEPEAALRHLRAAWDEAPADAKVGAIGADLANDFLKAEEYSRALQLSRECLERGGLVPEVEAALMLVEGGALYYLDANAEAEKVAREVVARFPDEALGPYLLAMALHSQQKQKSALPFARLAAEKSPDDGDCHYLLGVLSKEVGDYREAVRSFGRAGGLMREAGRTPAEEYFANLSYCYGKLNDAAMCAKIAGEGLAHYPESEMLKANYKAGYKAQIQRR